MADHDRMSATVASCRDIEDSGCHMHVGAVLMFDAAPVRTPDGGMDIERISRAIHARLPLVPRSRQRISYVPYERVPIWIDDDRFRLAYHVRHTALPRPGDDRVLKRLVGRIMSQPLDRTRPLWEMWVVEGLEGDRFALISKTHHCMVDGVSGADLMSVLLDAVPDGDVGTPEPWSPRRQPSRARLMVDAGLRRAAQPGTALRVALDAARAPRAALHDVAEAAGGLAQPVWPAFDPVSRTPLNVGVGPHRRFDWTAIGGLDLKAVNRT